jgi:hypothetical protein
MKRITFILVFLFPIVIKSLDAAPIKISFLDNKNAIKQTTDFLLQKGCDKESVRLFQKGIDLYNSTPSDLDLKKFPPPENGFYSFQSVSDLVKALPRPLIYTGHRSELNCFDTVILLAGNQIQTTLHPDDLTGPFLPPSTKTNFEVVAEPAATPRDAYNKVWPSWYNYPKGIFTESMQDKRICLTAALDSYYFLPLSTTRQNFGTNLLRVVKSIWKREGVKFPRNLQVVICYDGMIFDQDKFFQAVSSHAGLLFQNEDEYVFIEKFGTNAPYVRFDFRNESDLLAWLRAETAPILNKDELLFVSFDDQRIKQVE